MLLIFTIVLAVSQTLSATVPIARDWVDHITWVSTLLLVIAGFLAIWVARRTLDGIEKQVEIMLRQTRATEIAADAAKRSADIAEKAMRLLESADVLMGAAGLDTSPDVHRSSEAYFEFMNFGRTRARNVVLEVTLRADGMEDVENKPPKFTLGAGASQKVQFPPFASLMPEDVLRGIREEQITLTYYAKVTFDDIFGDSHSIEYTGKLSVSKGQFTLIQE